MTKGASSRQINVSGNWHWESTSVINIYSHHAQSLTMYFDSKDKSSTYFLSLVTPLSGLDTAQVQTPAPEDRTRPVSVTLKLSWEDRGWRLETGGWDTWASGEERLRSASWHSATAQPPATAASPSRHGTNPAPASSLNVTEYVNTWTSYDKLAIYRLMNWLYVCLKVTFKSVFGSTICASSVKATEYDIYDM